MLMSGGARSGPGMSRTLTSPAQVKAGVADPDLHESVLFLGSWIRIRIRVKSWIWIRIKVNIQDL